MIRQLWMHKRDGCISVLILAGLILFLTLLVLSPIAHQKDRYRSELSKDARVLQQLRAIDNARENLEITFKEYQSNDLQSLVYSKIAADSVTLDIQRRVSTELNNAKAQVLSISPLPVTLQDDYSKVGVQVKFSATMPALMQALSAFEQDKPLLLIDSIRISPEQIRVRRGEVVPQRVSVDMTVFTFLVPKGDQEVLK
ncbi:MAG: type II secretion system protein GspM [Pseudomonas sp.]|nr:type II secretion system protein GspM [Pseudomonas sp.]